MSKPCGFDLDTSVDPQYVQLSGECDRIDLLVFKIHPIISCQMIWMVQNEV
jgi:hypothetical protein